MINSKIKPFRALTLALALFVSYGCATKAQVEEIVNGSNILISSGYISLDQQSAKELATKTPEEIIAKIDNFIALNPGLTVTNNALRLRQAIVYLSMKEYNMAKAAFKQVNLGDIKFQRDRMIFNLKEVITDWYQADKSEPLSFEDAGKWMKEVRLQLDNTPDSEGNITIKDYFAELHSWIGFNAARLFGGDYQKDYFTKAANYYSKYLDLREIDLDGPSDKLSLVKLRLMRRAETVRKYALDSMKNIEPEKLTLLTEKAKKFLNISDD